MKRELHIDRLLIATLGWAGIFTGVAGWIVLLGLFFGGK